MSNLNPADFAFINTTEFRLLESKFNEYASSDEISFEDFKEIINSSNKINKEIINSFLDKVKKKFKDSGIHPDNEHLNKTDFFFYMDQLLMENNKYLNEKDPELKNLFDILTNEEPLINKSRLMQIITEFDLPIMMTEFFRPLSNLGKKEEFSFSEFCYLFKSNITSKGSFFNSISNLNKEGGETITVFPIIVQPK